VLTSFLGTASALSAAGTLSSATLHELDITPVTTAAVAVYYKIYGNYSSLTPVTYSTLVQTYSADILAISAGVKSVGDNLCTPTAAITNTASLAEQIATAAGLSSATAATSVTVAQVGSYLGASCAAYLNNLQTQIQASSIFGPQLLHESGETSLIGAGTTTITTTTSPYAGSYTLSGVISETGIVVPTTMPQGTYVTGGSNLAAPVTANIVIGSNGAVTSSGIGATVSGQVSGNLITLTITNTSSSYTLTGRLMTDLQVSGGSAYLVQASGNGPSEAYCSSACTTTSPVSSTAAVLTNFNGVLSGSGAVPLWNGGSYSAFTNGATLGGIACGAGTFPLRLSTSGVLPLSVVGECVTPTATAWTTAAVTTFTTSSSIYYSDNGNYLVSGATANSTINPASLVVSGSWSEVSGSTFILTASATYTPNSTSTPILGTLYYVAGSSNIVFAASSGNPTTCGTGLTGTCNLSPNGLLTMGNNELHAGSSTTVSQLVSQQSNSHVEVQGLGEMGGH
jgi:hypothetical protein